MVFAFLEQDLTTFHQPPGAGIMDMPLHSFDVYSYLDLSIYHIDLPKLCIWAFSSFSTIRSPVANIIVLSTFLLQVFWLSLAGIYTVLHINFLIILN